MTDTFRPMTVDQVLQSPGTYEVDTGSARFFIEVDADGTCYQLNPEGQRDGVLSRDGWTVSRVWARKVVA